MNAKAELVIDLVFGGGHRFWKQGTREVLVDAAEMLLDYMTTDEAEEILSAVVSAVREEYGE